MSLIKKILKPKWKSADPKTRLLGIAELGSADDQILLELALTDEDEAVQQAALAKIERLDSLKKIAAESGNQSLAGRASERWQQKLCRLVCDASEAIDPHDAIKQITSEAILAEIAINAPSPALRLAAVEKIKGSNILFTVLTHPCGKNVGLAALEKITDRQFLERAALEGASKTVQHRAKERVQELKAQDPVPPETIRENAIANLLEKANIAVETIDIDRATELAAELQKEAERLDNFKGIDPRYEIFCNTLEQLQVRREEISRLKDEQLQRQQLRDEKITALESICDDIEQLMVAENEQSRKIFQAKCMEWETTLAALQKNYPVSIYDRYKKLCNKFNRIRDLADKEWDQKRRFAEQLQTLFDDRETIGMHQFAKELDSLQRTLSKLTFKYISNHSLQQRIEEGLNVVAEHRDMVARQQDAIRQANAATRRDIIETLEKAVHSDAPSLEDGVIKEFRKKWSETTDLPTDQSDQSQRFEDLLAEIRLKFSDSRKQKDWELWANKSKMEDLINGLNALDAENDLHKVYHALRDAQSVWKEIGPAPPKEGQALWKAFQAAADKQFARCKDFFEELDRQARENQLMKEKFCEQAESLAHSTDWKKTTDALIALQHDWKKAGNASRHEEEALYKRFRQACDVFFENKKDHYAEIDRSRQGNQQEKEALCIEAEALLKNLDPKLNRDFQALQKKWKKIGPAPRKAEQQLWKRFRKACDQFYNWLDSLKPENLKEKTALCEEAEKIDQQADSEPDWRTMTPRIINLQEQWKEIGPVPKDEHDAIWTRFRAACDSYFAKKEAHDAVIDAQRADNEEKKKVCLDRVLELIETNDKSAAKEISEIQEGWKEIGPASKENDRDLYRQFKSTCDNYFKNRRLDFREREKNRQDNLKRKEALVVRLELLCGDATDLGQAAAQNKSLTLAEQFKLAREARFMTAGSGRDDEMRKKKEEYNAIVDEWLSIGPVPREHEKLLRRRYNAAVDSFQNLTGRGKDKKRTSK